MKILITILLALFISSNTYADEERATRDSNIMKYGEVLASGVVENGNMIMIMKYKDGTNPSRVWHCVVYFKNSYTFCSEVKYDLN